MIKGRDFIKIIDRIKNFKGLKSDISVAETLGMTQSTFAERKRRGSIPYEELIIFCDKEGISLNWLLTGEGEIKREKELEVYCLAPAAFIEDGEITYMTNKGPMAFSDICHLLNKNAHETTAWIEKQMRRQKREWTVQPADAIYNERSDAELAEIITMLKEHPQDKKLVLKLLKGKKDIKEALEGFEISKIMEQEG